MACSTQKEETFGLDYFILVFVFVLFLFIILVILFISFFGFGVQNRLASHVSFETQGSEVKGAAAD